MHRALLFLLFPAAISIAAPPPLPTPLTSFGAASSNGYVYVFGGHMAKAHDYSTATASGALRRLSLTTPLAWENLPGNIPLQSPGVAEWNGKIYLVGGMQPQNEPGQPQKLISMSEAAVFDPDKRAWSDLPPLPEPRSSHAVAVLYGKLYAVGGWPLHVGVPESKGGKASKKDYHDTMAVLDLAKPEAGWKPLPQDFKRRALAAAAFAGKIWCIGGMTEDNDLSAEVDIYDPATAQWSKGPEVPGDGSVKGFGCAVCATRDALYLSPQGKKIFRMSPDGKSWLECGDLAKARYFHQLVAMGKDKLMALGGTRGGAAIADVEVVSVKLPPSEVDWPQFQGPRRDNTTTETDWKKKWPVEGPRILWQGKLGVGIGSFAVVADRVYASGNDGEGTDTILCLDLETGVSVWEHRYPCRTAAHMMPIVPNGPCATPEVSAGRVYSISREGDVLCLDAATGKPAWCRNMVADLKGKRPVYGYASSPLVQDGRLYLDAGGSGGSTVCLDAATGGILWAKGIGEAGYASPFISRNNGRDILIVYKGEALKVLDPQTGDEIASYATTTNDFCNTATPPITAAGFLLVSHTGNDGATGLKLEGGHLVKCWNIPDLGMLFNSGVPFGDHSFLVFNDQVRGANDMRCLDAVTGMAQWQSADIDKGAAILSDGYLIALSAKGEVILAKPSSSGIEVIARSQVLSGKCWALPVLSHHRLLCRNNAGDAVCLDLKP